VAADDKQKLERYYGEGIPDLNDEGSKWKEFLDNKWKEQRRWMRDKRLHWIRHRLFRIGHQWLSNRDGRQWREPQADSNTVRSTMNLVGPALDYRLGVLREQRPGFRYEPLSSNTNAREQADAQQVLVEYYFHVLDMWKMFEVAFAAAQTDGVAFVHVFVDQDAGPKQEMVKLIPPTDTRYKTFKALGFEPDEQGNLKLPLDEDGEEVEDPDVVPIQEAEGDLRCRVVTADETLADPEAKTINGPYDGAKWFMVRRLRDVKDARLETGKPELQPDVTEKREEDAYGMEMGVGRQGSWQKGLPPFPTTRRDWKESVYDYLFFMAPSPVYEDGAWIRIVGTEVIGFEEELPGGVIPFARITDGSSDPDLYPRPVMADWIGDQVAINALLSLLLSNARIWGAGRMLVQKDTVIEESFSTLVGSLVEYSGLRPEAIQPPRTSGDLWQLLSFLIKKLEDKSGWNDLARGQVTGDGGMQDVSGRALLGAREMFERTLGPMVRASADGVTEWSKLIVRHGMWLFDGNPRRIPTMGDRPDLSKRIDKEKLGDRPVVYADAETLIPLPRALRNQMLLDMVQQGMITINEYRKRAPYADVRDAFSGDQAQAGRAQIINEVYFENWEEFDGIIQKAMASPDETEATRLMLDLYLNPKNGIMVLWTDDPAVHMEALLQIIADERKAWPMRRLAMDRYSIYEDLQEAKLQLQMPPVPDPNTGQMPPPPEVPVEVIGAPEHLQRKGIAPPAPPAPTGGPGGGGSAPPTTLVDPASSPTTVPASATDTAEPVGSFGGIEEAAAAKEGLEV